MLGTSKDWMKLMVCMVCTIVSSSVMVDNIEFGWDMGGMHPDQGGDCAVEYCWGFS